MALGKAGGVCRNGELSFPTSVQNGIAWIPATTRFPTRAARLRPAPGALPVAAHLHHGLPVSPAPTPGSRRASGTSLPPPGETGGQSIQPTEAIQAV